MRSGHGFQNRLGPRKSATPGGVAEWSNAPVLKTGVRESVPWVRIPPPPPRGFHKSLIFIEKINIILRMSPTKSPTLTASAPEFAGSYRRSSQPQTPRNATKATMGKK
jgi:hypothetical protein